MCMYIEEGGEGYLWQNQKQKEERGYIPHEGAGGGGADCHETVARRTDSSVSCHCQDGHTCEPHTDREHV